MRARFPAVFVAAFSMLGPAAAQAPDVEIGVLTCDIEGLSAPADAPAPTQAESQARDAVCTFKPRNGADETYTGVVRGMSLTPDKGGAAIWKVKAAAEAPASGLLQQAYAVDPAIPADQSAPLVGESNSRIVLQSMADKPEGSATATEKPRPTGFIIINIELKLKAASG
jgi:hypothetical protein